MEDVLSNKTCCWLISLSSNYLWNMLLNLFNHKVKTQIRIYPKTYSINFGITISGLKQTEWKYHTLNTLCAHHLQFLLELRKVFTNILWSFEGSAVKLVSHVTKSCVSLLIISLTNQINKMCTTNHWVSNDEY